MIEKLNNLPHVSINSLNTEQCLRNPIADYLPTLSVHSLIFVAYTHGSEEAILIAKQEYVNAKNAYFFANSLFYACSCLTAKELGKHLIFNNCSVFVGYNATITTVRPETEPVFQECENAFLFHFLRTTNTIQESLAVMYRTYNDMMIHVDTFTAGILDKHLSAFQILCNEDALQFTRQNFINH
jgi:hypothetical protein